MSGEASGTWLVKRIVAAGREIGPKLSPDEVLLLETPMWELKDSDRDTVLALNNKVVPLVRQAIDQEKSQGAKTVKVRMGLRVPGEWAQHYGVIWRNNLPWVVSGIMQNAMLANTPAGEIKKWRSA